MTADAAPLTGVTAHARGSALSLTVVPRSPANSLEKLSNGALRVRITAPPVDGAANAALLRFLADVLGVPRSRLTISAGESSRRKRVVIEGISPDDVARRLASVL